MKKHILGVALFSLIVASFVLLYAFFYAPAIPPKSAVKPPVSRTEAPPEKPNFCNLKRNKFTYEVQSSELYIREGRLISKLKLGWNGYGELPKNVYVKARIFDINKPENISYISSDIFSSVFNNSRRDATVIFDQKFVDSNKALDTKSNLYVVFDVSEQSSNTESLFEKGKLNEASPVLTINDYSSKNYPPAERPKGLLRGKSIPK